MNIPQNIFRAYDIRGVVDEALTPELVYAIGQAIGSEAQKRNQEKVIIARDGRLSGPVLIERLRNGLLDSGCDVTDIGMVPTPLLSFATHILDTQSGVMLTGSHNPANYNGLKITIAGKTLSEQDIQTIYQRVLNKEFNKGKGHLEITYVDGDYIQRVSKDIKLKKPLKVVLDCGNGVAGEIAPKLFKSLGCEVIPLFCEVDGNFPNHHPDPAELENLTDLIKAVKDHQADIGFAFDGDADRLGVVTNKGEVIWPDRQLMFLARDLLKKHPGETIVFDVKCSRHLINVIKENGGKPLMWKTGHSLIKSKMREDNVLLAGEMSGHIFYKDRWYGFDDALYVGARMLEILSESSQTSSELFAELPDSINTPELKCPVADDEKFDLMEKLVNQVKFDNAEINRIDGLRVDFKEGWGLVRPSNTTPFLVMRFEAESEESIKHIQEQFRQQLLAVDSTLELPF